MTYGLCHDHDSYVSTYAMFQREFLGVNRLIFVIMVVNTSQMIHGYKVYVIRIQNHVG